MMANELLMLKENKKLNIAQHILKVGLQVMRPSTICRKFIILGPLLLRKLYTFLAGPVGYSHVV